MTSGSAAGDGMHHGDTTEVVTLKAGETGTVSHTFDKAGTFLIACHQPGHYAGGMKATVVVT